MPVPLENASLTDSLCEVLRKHIIAGDVAPGQRLSETWVAERFDVARPTAKASIDRLAGEGLLRRGRYKSALVPKLSADDIADLYFSREPIESSAIRALAAKSEVPADAERALKLMTVTATMGEHSEHTEADIALHKALVAAVGSPRLRRMHDTVMGESQLCIAQVRAKVGVDLVELTDRHGAILDAIRAGDPDGAVVALQRDLHGCRDALLADVARAEAGATAAPG